MKFINLDPLISFVARAHSDGTDPSQMRLLVTAVVGTIMLMWVAHNIAAIMHGAGFVTLPPAEAGVIAAMIGGKVWQSKYEGKV